MYSACFICVFLLHFTVGNVGPNVFDDTKSGCCFEFDYLKIAIDYLNVIRMVNQCNIPLNKAP